MIGNTKGGMELTRRILTANAQGRAAFIPFIPAAFPTAEGFANTLVELDAGGADIIEIGVPFSDPVADGPVIAEASQKALENGATLDYIFETLRHLHHPLRAAVVLMGYLNPFLQYGVPALAEACRESGVSGLIIPDLPIDEDTAIRATLVAHDLALIPLVGPNTSENRMRKYAAAVGREGFVYVVSALGTTGVRRDFSEVRDVAAQTLVRARAAFGTLPLALGFGISTREQFTKCKLSADAVIVGSALVQHLADGGSAANFVAKWHKA